MTKTRIVGMIVQVSSSAGAVPRSRFVHYAVLAVAILDAECNEQDRNEGEEENAEVEHAVKEVIHPGGDGGSLLGHPERFVGGLCEYRGQHSFIPVTSIAKIAGETPAPQKITTCFGAYPAELVHQKNGHD